MHSLPILLALLPCSLQAGPAPQTPEINVVGGVRGICVALGGALWFVTSKGHAYFSSDRGALWREAPLPVRPSDEWGSDADTLEHVGFFDSKHGVIAGYIGEAKNLVFVTDDGGEKWTQVALPEELWVYDSWIGPGPHGWLVGSTGSVLHTADAGGHWSVWSRPFNGASRSRAICARDEQHVVVASLDGALLMTEDGGKAWKSIPAPGGKLTQLIYTAKGLVCAGENGVKICDDPPSGEWRELRIESEPCIAVARHPQGLLCQLRSQAVVLVDDQLALVQRWPEHLAGQASCLAGIKDFSVALLDVEGAYAVLDGAGVRSPGMHAAAADQLWPMTEFDRAGAGPMFGISKRGLYESVDAGRQWRQVSELEGPDLVRALADGSGAFVRSGNKCWLWSSTKQEATPIPVLDPINWGFEIFRREPLWLAVGSRYEGEFASRLVGTSDTVLAGPGFESLVFGSADGGRSWHELLRIPECTVFASFFGDDNVLSLLLTKGEVDRVAVELATADGGQPALPAIKGPVVVQPIESMPQWLCWIEFVDGLKGELGGNIYFGGSIVCRTADGGKSWVADPTEPDGMHPEFQFLRLGGGHWLRLELPYKEPSRVDIWERGTFHVLRQFELDIHDAHIDAAGRLLLRLSDSAVWSLSADGVQWTRLTDTLIPGR